MGSWGITMRQSDYGLDPVIFLPLQEIIRMILEAIYEPTFSDRSHGFRPKRSCHTALSQIKDTFQNTVDCQKDPGGQPNPHSSIYTLQGQKRPLPPLGLYI